MNKSEKTNKKNKKAVINQNKCDKSPFCPVKRVCPVGAVNQAGFFGGQITINDEKCIGCGKCISYCPHQAVFMK